MSDIAISKTTVAVPDRSWLRNPQLAGQALSGVAEVSAFNQAAHWPDGFLLGGLLIGQQTDTGEVGPFTPGGSGGLQTLTGIVIGGFKIRLLSTGSPAAARVTGAYIPVGTPIQLIASRLPQLRQSDGTMRAPTTAELTTNTSWILTGAS